MVPNSDIYTGAVTVRTASPRRRMECEVGIGYGDDITAACNLIVETLLNVEGVENDGNLTKGLTVVNVRLPLDS